jgi:hypothetical protein
MLGASRTSRRPRRRPIPRRRDFHTPSHTQEAADGDTELASFIKQKAGSFDYHLIRMVCTFIDKPGRRIESAWTKVDRTRLNGGDHSDSQSG